MMRFLFLLILLGLTPVAAAQVATVPMGDPVYHDLDRVLATGLVDYGFAGQRPYTRREIARMVASAQRKLPSPRANQATTRIIARLAERFATEIHMLGGGVRGAWTSRLLIHGEVMGLSSPARGIPDDPVGSVDATINPLVDGRAGRSYMEGASAAIEADQEVLFSSWFAARVRPRAIAGRHAGRNDHGPSMQAASAAVKMRNIVAEIGRQEIVLGQGMEGGLMSSTSSRPLDMLRFTTDAPFRAPLFSRVLGPMRGTVLVADLGADQRFPHSAFVEYKLSTHPFRRLEIAAAVSAILLGEGAPRTSAWNYFIDLVPPLKYLLPDDSAQFSNKMAGWEYRLRIPEWRGLQMYAEHAFDDMDPRRWGSTFWEDGGHLVGVSMQNLAGDGALSATAELHHTGLRFYQHANFTSGMAFNGTLLGSPLGNEADAGYLRVRWDGGGVTTLTVDVSAERRDGDVITVVATQPDLSGFRFERVAFNPAERRQRAVVSFTRDAARRRMTLRAGVERVANFSFVGGARRTNFLIGATVDAFGR